MEDGGGHASQVVTASTGWLWLGVQWADGEEWTELARIGGEYWCEVMWSREAARSVMACGGPESRAEMRWCGVHWRNEKRIEMTCPEMD